MSQANLVEMDRLMDTVAGDFELFKMMVEVFKQEAGESLQKLEAALNASESTGVRMYGHKIKGSISPFTRRLPYEVASSLEKAGESGDTAKAATLFVELKGSIDQLNEELEGILKTGF